MVGASCSRYPLEVFCRESVVEVFCHSLVGHAVRIELDDLHLPVDVIADGLPGLHASLPELRCSCEVSRAVLEGPSHPVEEVLNRVDAGLKRPKLVEGRTGE